ncbi:MAG TPA: 2-oxoacid:ferredoxin oxidoreductase subunit beta [Longimicrobiales bacterium]|nr:2-oxoacid:ferredoxin oxidoreductase subunit beta [Longimicrobiales bacterium]
MSYIAKPKVRHPGLERNAAGLTRRDYEGSMSTLCAGCGHDSITAALIEAFFDLDLEPHRVAKLSGIGCSGKTPAYFLSAAHGFNGVHGRMPAIATGVAAANRELTLIGISGDGDSLSIGLGQLSHAIRRNVDMLYVIENNGVYGLTKGQFSASADVGSKSKKGEANRQRPIDPVFLALTLGASFVARSFSGDKRQLVPIIEAGIAHRGFALIDIVSPCVTFNDHEASTKSYRYTRGHNRPVIEADFVPPAVEITASQAGGSAGDVRMHDGSVVRFRKVPDEYDPSDRDAVYAFLRERQGAGELPTGLLYLDPTAEELHDVSGTVAGPLVDVPYERLCPGAVVLEEIQGRFR